jgi:hypothetical protein
MVKLNQIVGSVGRYREFTNTFLPRPQVMLDRWVAVDMTMNSLRGLPPVELYKIGDGYFVIDGNHRISVARANRLKDLEASVIEWQTRIHFTVDDFRSGRWLLKAAYNDFLAQTKLDQLRPQQQLDVTNAQHYQTLLQHIEVHRYLTNHANSRSWGGCKGRTLSWEEAAVSWYDTVYMPLVEAMRAHKLQAQFPKRTETDLYVWITEHREEVAEQYCLAPLDPATAVATFAANRSERALQRLGFALQHTARRFWHWGLEQAKLPPGLSEHEFCALRLRHDAGELSIAEARHKQLQEATFVENLCESRFGMQFCA